MLVFLSHATADHAITEAIRRHLSALGVDVYCAEHDNQAGNRLTDKVVGAVRRSDLVVVLLTPRGYDSAYVQQEIGIARAAGKLVVPLLDPALAKTSLGVLEDVEYIELDPVNPTEGVVMLAERVAGIARRQQRDELILVAGAVVLVAMLIYLDSA